MSDDKKLTVEEKKNTTPVSVSKTKIEYFDRESKEEKTLDMVGRVSLPDSKEIVSGLGENNVFISKSNYTENFRVNSDDLYAMKTNLEGKK